MEQPKVKQPKTVLQKIGWLWRIFERSVSHAAEVVGSILLAAMVLVVSYICFTRYALNFTPPWGEEVALLCMVWFGFMAIALGVRDDGHIGITLFDRFYPPALLRLLNIFKYVAILAFSGYFMIPMGYRMAKVGSWNKLPGLGISSYWMYIIVAASGVAVFVYAFEKLYRAVFHPRTETNDVPEQIEEEVVEKNEILQRDPSSGEDN